MNPVNLKKITASFAWLSEAILLHGDQKDISFGRARKKIPITINSWIKRLAREI